MKLIRRSVMNRISKARVLTLTTALVVALALILAQGSRPAFADTNGCPNGGIGNPQTSALVGASFSISGDTATYTFESFFNQHPVDGVPGLIEYCVYPVDVNGDPLAPDNVTVQAGLIGDNGAAWTDPPNFDNFSFQRPDGNPSNIGFHGTSTTMGTATWSGGVPSQTILL